MNTTPVKAGSTQRKTYDVRTLRVRDIQDLGLRLRRVLFEVTPGEGFDPQYPGQWIKILVPVKGSHETVGRPYTIRRWFPHTSQMEIDFVLHSGGPGTQWAQELLPGNTAEFMGPAGEFRIDSNAEWYIFAGDETAFPAIAAIVERLPADRIIRLYLESKNAIEQHHVFPENQGAICWLPTNGAPKPRFGLIEAMESIVLPPGNGQVWVAGENTAIQMVRKILIGEKKLPRQALHASGYWRSGKSAERDPESDY